MMTQITPLKTILSLLAMFALSSCGINKDANFTVIGNVTDSYGNPVVINASENIEVCIKADYITDKGIAGSGQECADLITNQTGAYSVPVLLEINSSRADKKIFIKNARVFGRKEDDSNTSNHFIFPMNITKSEIGENGGTINANIAIFDFN